MSKVVMSQDIENVLAAKSVSDQQLNKAINAVNLYEKEIEKIKSELEVMTQKALHAEENEQRMRNIMTQNIVASNKEKQLLLDEILELKGVIKQLRG